MKFTCAALLSLTATSNAFMTTPCMKADGLAKATTRGDFAKVAAGAAAATFAAASPALAKGKGPKQNLFGVVGSDMEIGGGASSYAAGTDTYSAYSPYSEPSKSLFANSSQDYMLKVKIDILKDSQKKLEAIPAFIEDKKWEEVRSMLTGKAYSLRNAMNSLAEGKPEAAKAAKTFFKDIEQISVNSARKDQAGASAAYSKSQEDLKKYLELL
ncbi:unnamed protein product [Discosporangium mesarthrocarpum]